MRTREDYIVKLQECASELEAKFGVKELKLFGSVARGENTESSDVDIFVVIPNLDSIYTIVSASEYLEKQLGCSVDLISDHKGIRPFFRKQIEKDGITIIPTA